MGAREGAGAALCGHCGEMLKGHSELRQVKNEGQMSMWNRQGGVKRNNFREKRIRFMCSEHGLRGGSGGSGIRKPS